MFFILGYFPDILVLSKKKKNDSVIVDMNSTISSQLTTSSNR